MKRRDFLKYSALAGLSSMMSPLSLFGDASFDDYKALVVVLQHGGNDSVNMFVPSGLDSLSGYDNYASIRASLGIKNLDLSGSLNVESNKLRLSRGNLNPYYLNGKIENSYTKGFYKSSNIDGLAVNSLMPELAHLINKNKVAIVSNVGNLIKPTTRQEIIASTASLPPFLYSHNSQRKLMFNANASSLKSMGWAGNIADHWNGVNGESVYTTNISFSGVSHLLYGNNTEPLILKANSPMKYKNIKRIAHDNWMAQNKNGIFKSIYNEKRKHAFKLQDVLLNDWENSSPTFTSKNAYNEELFSVPSNATLGIDDNDNMGIRLIEKFESVARLAYIGKNKGLKRQIFYIVQGGYDTHSKQSQKHAELLRELSMGLGDFSLALNDMGMEQEVTTFNISDFGRSIGNNGDGTDHAWGAHHFAMGGAVKAGLYGTLPDLTLGGNDDASSKGRLIPSISSSQYIATLVKWFGANEATLSSIFPELSNFSNRNIGFMS